MSPFMPSPPCGPKKHYFRHGGTNLGILVKAKDAQVQPSFQGGDPPDIPERYRGVVAGGDMRGWLCPALGLYFHAAPPRIFVKAEALPARVDPIWHVNRDEAKRFVSASR
jgi:hypothetical protein